MAQPRSESSSRRSLLQECLCRKCLLRGVLHQIASPPWNSARCPSLEGWQRQFRLSRRSCRARQTLLSEPQSNVWLLELSLLGRTRRQRSSHQVGSPLTFRTHCRHRGRSRICHRRRNLCREPRLSCTALREDSTQCCRMVRSLRGRRSCHLAEGLQNLPFRSFRNHSSEPRHLRRWCQGCR